ncbi:hypothetical protein QYF48_16145 [Brevibacillus agri]|uniref:hypothetical protein n=1 Tax=Brevibacillus agri TaxID=51101 RepID=UPI0025B68D01|nr:hypothetical protein [Brevibacillus agri]MDN4094340.1 hypothetical protein [Brevibacillus agri]
MAFERIETNRNTEDRKKNEMENHEFIIRLAEEINQLKQDREVLMNELNAIKEKQDV